MTCHVISKPYGRESHEGKVQAVKVSPPLLNVPEDDSRDDYEDDEAGNYVAEELEAQDDCVLNVVIRFRLTTLKFWQLQKNKNIVGFSRAFNFFQIYI